VAERHVFTCDVCGEEVIAVCDGKEPVQRPDGWTHEGVRDYCAECSALNAAMDGE
jgi:hypothetical protein